MTLLQCDSNSKQSEFTGIDTMFYERAENGDNILLKFMVYTKYNFGKRTNTKVYYENMTLFTEINFVDNCPNGVIKLYHDNGKIKSFSTYENGAQIGPDLLFDKEGHLSSYYNADTIFGEHISLEFYPTGILKQKDIISDSAADVSYYHPNGQLSHKVIRGAGKQPLYSYYENGQLAVSGFIYDAEWTMIGHWQEWYANGKRKAEFFIDEQPPFNKIGLWKYWNEKGKLTETKLYKDNILQKTRRY